MVVENRGVLRLRDLDQSKVRRACQPYCSGLATSLWIREGTLHALVQLVFCGTLPEMRFGQRQIHGLTVTP